MVFIHSRLLSRRQYLKLRYLLNILYLALSNRYHNKNLKIFV